jgi:hypothetical protein
MRSLIIIVIILILGLGVYWLYLTRYSQLDANQTSGQALDTEATEEITGS